MKATDALRQDHRDIRRLERLVRLCCESLASGRLVPLGDIRRICHIMGVFLDSIHYSREEDSYFPCVAAYGTLNGQIHKLLIEHEFSRRIAAALLRHLEAWESGTDSREPVHRYLRTYAIYLDDHMRKEEEFFDNAATMLSPAEEREMYEQFRFAMDTASRIDDIMHQIAYLERQPWAGASSGS